MHGFWFSVTVAAILAMAALALNECMKSEDRFWDKVATIEQDKDVFGSRKPPPRSDETIYMHDYEKSGATFGPSITIISDGRPVECTEYDVEPITEFITMLHHWGLTGEVTPTKLVHCDPIIGKE